MKWAVLKIEFSFFFRLILGQRSAYTFPKNILYFCVVLISVSKHLTTHILIHFLSLKSSTEKKIQIDRHFITHQIPDSWTNRQNHNRYPIDYPLDPKQTTPISDNKTQMDPRYTPNRPPIAPFNPKQIPFRTPIDPQQSPVRLPLGPH